MHFFVQFDTRPESIAEANAIYTAFSDAIHTSGMSATEISQVVNWVITSTAKGGLISTNTSATPFYSLTQNPYNITLSANQSTIVTWTVNATGAIGQNYTFFAYANRTANLSAGAVTSIWNVSIVNQSGTQPPAVSITYPTSNGKYNINVSAFNYTVSGDNVSNCWYSTNSGAANSSTVSPGINFTNVLSTEGSNTWIVYCNSSNLTGTNSVAFTKDTIFPNVTSNSPTDGYIDTVATSLSVTFNCSGADNLGLMNLSLYLTNSLNTSFVSNQTTSTNGTINSTAWTLNLIKGNYTWNCLASDSIGNFNWSTNRTVLLQTNSNPTITLNSPTNNSLLNKNGLVLLNATVNDADGSLNNLTVWFFGGYSNKTDVLINITYNQVPGTDVTFNWTGLNNTGKYNWTVIASDGKINSSNQFFYFERLNLTVTCEAGGNYQLGALVLIQGAVTNGTVILSSYPVNVSIYHINNSLNTFQNLTTANDGGYETSFSGLGVGSYALNASVSHLGYNETCKDTFSVGSAASFILDKVIAVHNITSTIINYNITLRATNKGGSDVASARLTDADSSDSPYSFDINANTTIQKNYLKSYTLNSSTYNSTLVIARVNATDAYSGTETAANSSLIILAIPASSTSEQLTLTKNAYYNSESSTKVNYTLSINVVNSGGTDLTAISIIDTDLSLNIVKNLNRTQNYTYSDSILIDKAASNTNKLFVQASATVNAVAYQSNQIQVRIPGYGGPADAIVNALASVTASASFDTPITVENKNTDIGQDFTIDYWITNQGETVNYTSGQQTIYVAASGNSDFTATLTAPSTAGTYRYKTVVTWAGGTATAYDTFTVAAAGGGGGGGGSGGGGGGGGTAAPITNIISKYYESAGSGSTVSVDAQRIDFAIIEVSFIVLDKQEKVTLSIEKIEDNSKVSEPLDHTYEYYSLEKTNVKDKDVSNAVIRFKVAKSWLELNNYDEKKVSLNRYSEKWVKLPTIMIEDTATHYFYEATTLGFSLFAITAEEKNAEGSEAMGEGITGKIVAEIVCNPPYIRYGKDCCLDQNNNLICDGDEIMVEGKAIEEKKELEKKSELVVGIKTLGSYLEGVILGIAKKANSISSSTVSKIFFWLALAVGIVMGIRKLKFWIGKKILRREDETDRHGFINRMLTKSFSHRRSDDEDEI